MANKRMVSGQTFEDEFFTVLPLFDRLLWLGQITACADDQGRFQDNAALIRSRVFPMDDIQLEDISNALNRFADSGKITRYVANGKKLIQIVNWWKHQQPNWAMKSVYPPPPGWMDRERYTSTNRNIVSVNWDKPGGYEKDYIHEYVVDYPREQDKYKNNDKDNVNDEYKLSDDDLPFQSLLDAFIDESKIPSFTGHAPTWVESLKKLQEAGCTPDDIREGIRTNKRKNYPVVTPKSILVTAVGAMSNRLSPAQEKKTTLDESLEAIKSWRDG